VEEIIDPRETRPYLCRFIALAAERVKIAPGPKPRYGCRP
jgi:methylmalonyl-CoA decarboxylase subunit alpha